MASTTTQLAPLFVLAAFVPLGFLLWQLEGSGLRYRFQLDKAS
jgi:hypothetical protein